MFALEASVVVIRKANPQASENLHFPHPESFVLSHGTLSQKNKDAHKSIFK
jgi:hypothetical protein